MQTRLRPFSTAATGAERLPQSMVSKTIVFWLALLVSLAAPRGAAQAKDQNAAELGKQVANPLSDMWLMQFQQNNNWIGMPLQQGDRVESNLQFQPLMPVKLTGEWNLVTRPVLQLFNSTS